MPAASAVSNARADRAGAAFREWAAANPAAQEATLDETQQEVAVIAAYRALHAYPLKKVTMGVRVMIRTELGPTAPRPGQRFKRMDRILGKLLRFPHMRLSQMEDIGGCRAIVATVEEVYSVASRMRKRWPHANVHDHIAQPKPDGYRALHVIEKRDGRLIEVQLRTARQHQWADSVERWSDRTGHNLKDGRGPADLRKYFAMAAERLAREDRREQPDEALEREFATLRERVRPYFVV